MAAPEGASGTGGSRSRRPQAVERRAARALFIIALCYAALLATHRGEFWPFSTYPMFSAVRPWARVIVRKVGDPVEGLDLDAEYTLEQLPGAPLALREHGIPQNDLSSLVQKAERWGPLELGAIRELFGSLPCERPVLILRVHGALHANAVHQLAAPVARLWCDEGGVKVDVAGRLRTAPPAG